MCLILKVYKCKPVHELENKLEDAENYIKEITPRLQNVRKLEAKIVELNDFVIAKENEVNLWQQRYSEMQHRVEDLEAQLAK